MSWYKEKTVNPGVTRQTSRPEKIVVPYSKQKRNTGALPKNGAVVMLKDTSVIGLDCLCDLQLQETHAAEQKKLSTEMEEVRAQMKKTQLRAEEVQGTFETHNGEYLRMKVWLLHHTCLLHHTSLPNRMGITDRD